MKKVAIVSFWSGVYYVQDFLTGTVITSTRTNNPRGAIYRARKKGYYVRVSDHDMYNPKVVTLKPIKNV